jgi:hypothetical protein
MLSRQEEMAERQRVFAQDQSLRGSTLHQHAQADALTPRGRFSAVDAATVVGSKSDVSGAYPAGPAWSADPGSQCVEPPLVDNPALEPSSAEAQAPEPTSDAPSSPLGAGVGSLSQNSGDLADQVTNRGREVGSPVRYRRR